MNLREGFKRLVVVLSLIPVLIGIVVFIGGLVAKDDRQLGGGFCIVFFGFGGIWFFYGIMLYIIHGFKTTHCANCEETIGKLEEDQIFKGHVVCIECHKKLSESK